MKKLSKAAHQIYQGHARSQVKLKRSLVRWETRFNQLLMDWLVDMDYAKVKVTKSQIDTQCSIFLNQAHREFDPSLDDEDDTKIYWDEILASLEESYFEWKQQTIPEDRTLRVKVSLMVPVGTMNRESINILCQALGGTYLEDFDTVSGLVANIERKTPVHPSRHDRLESYFQSLVADSIRNTYLAVNDANDEETESKIKNFRKMSSLKKKLNELALVYI